MLTLVEIDIQAVHESKHNPRRHFDGEKLRHLADNITQVGILTPLTVRPMPHSTPTTPSYEIGAGHRRYRAARLAKLALIPCLVREMPDQEFMELLNIENLQHEGLHPLDEAQGYADLMAAPYKMKVETVAEKVGRSVKYVYDRIKLLDLTKPARDLFWSGRIEAGHAILLARLTSTDQVKVIGTEAQEYHDGGLLVPEHRLFHDEDPEEGGVHLKAVSVHELDKHIKEHIRYNPKKVDTFLYPETAEAVTEAVTAKRKIIEITHEYLASDDVRSAGETKVYGNRTWTRADGWEDSKVCDRAVLGVLVSGPGQGEAFNVCVNKDKCLVHWGKEIRAREKRAKEREKGEATGKAAPKDKWAKERARQEAERERDRAAFARWETAMPALAEAIAERVKKMPTKASGWLAQFLIKDRRSCGDTTKLMKQYMPLGTSADDVVRFLACFALFQDMQQHNALSQFPKLAKYLGVDTKKILKAAAPEPQTSAPKKEKAA